MWCSCCTFSHSSGLHVMIRLSSYKVQRSCRWMKAKVWKHKKWRKCIWSLESCSGHKMEEVTCINSHWRWIQIILYSIHKEKHSHSDSLQILNLMETTCVHQNSAEWEITVRTTSLHFPFFLPVYTLWLTHCDSVRLQASTPPSKSNKSLLYESITSGFVWKTHFTSLPVLKSRR